MLFVCFFVVCDILQLYLLRMVIVVVVVLDGTGFAYKRSR